MKENNSYDKFSVSNEHKTKNFEVGVQCSIGLDTSDVVNKILAISVDANCAQVETLSGEANVNGNVFVKLVYLTETGLVGNAEYTSPFATTILDEKINTNSTLLTKVVETNGNVASLSGNIAKVDCALKLCSVCVNNEEISYLKETGNDVCRQNEETEYEKFEGMCSSTWTENLSLEVKDHIKQILSSSQDAFLLDVASNDGFVIANFEIVNKLMYLTNEEVPQVKAVYFKDTFKQEIECALSKKDYKVDICLSIQKENVKNVVEENDDKVKVNVEIPLCACVYVYSRNKVNVICDLYSTSNLTNVTNTSYLNTVLCEPIVFEKKVEGSVTLDENEPRIDKLLAVNYSKATPLNEYIENGTYTVSGIITSNLIYFNEDDNMVNSVDIELPFEVSTQTEYDGEYLTNLSILLEDVDVMVKKGRDIYLDATIKVRTRVCGFVRGAVISELEYGEQVAEKDCAIEIYFAKKGEKVWDIAKQLGVSPNVLYSQNSELEEVLIDDRKLALYYKNNV